MKKKTIILLIIVILLTAIPSAALGTPEDHSPEDNASMMFELGKLWAERPIGDGEIIASYKDFNVTKEEVEWKKEQAHLTGEKLGSTDLEIANGFIIGQLLLEDAERLGLASTPEEVDEWLDSLKQAIAEEGERLEDIDAYCAGAGITVDEYFENLRQDLPDTIARGKLKNHFIENYYKETGIADEIKTREDYDHALAAYDVYREELLQAHKDEIKYYKIS